MHDINRKGYHMMAHFYSFLKTQQLNGEHRVRTFYSLEINATLTIWHFPIRMLSSKVVILLQNLLS